MKKRLFREIIDDLYHINAWISCTFLTGFKQPKVKDMMIINKRLGEIIKELRNR